jgi:nucleotide-binding universal stress UspA family protein
MNGRYIVGIDGSSPSRSALDWAAARAERDGRAVVLAHVDTIADATDPQKQNGRDLLRECVEKMRELHPRLSFTPALAPGAVAWELARLTQRDDILVIGTHKTGYLNGRVLGSRSVQIALATDCTVVVIPDVDLRFRRGVVAGIDRSETAAGIARIAAREARDLGDGLLFVHSDKAPESVRSATARAPIPAALEASRDLSADLLVRSRISDREPAEALLDASRGKALLVLGPGDLDRSRTPLRSVMHDVLLNANAPVMIARTLDNRDDETPTAAGDVVSLSSS